MYRIKDEIENTIIIQKSEFITHIFRVDSIDEINSILENTRKKYYDATHNCYAYILGDNQEIQKSSDDGEPQKTAGAPMLDVLKKTDLIVTRAGASTIAEITVLGVPSIMIPSPYVTHNHQEKNALLLEEKGCTRVIKEKELSKDSLLNMIDKLITDDKLLKEMSDNNKKMGVKDSSTKIAHLIEELVGSEK